MGKQFTLRIEYDPYSENPLSREYDEGSVFTLHSFSTRHTNFSNPDVLLACQYEFPEGHEDEGFTCDAMPTAHAPGRIEDHAWDGPEGFLLSYFEHGSCKWGVAGTMSGMPDFRWDGVEFAGFLEITLDDDSRDWWNGLTDDEKEKSAEAACEVYTDWCNGSVYGYVLESMGECNMGYSHADERVDDSCWGYYGDDIIEAVKELVSAYNLTPENTEITGEAEGALWKDVFKVEVPA